MPKIDVQLTLEDAILEYVQVQAQNSGMSHAEFIAFCLQQYHALHSQFARSDEPLHQFHESVVELLAQDRIDPIDECEV